MLRMEVEALNLRVKVSIRKWYMFYQGNTIVFNRYIDKFVFTFDLKLPTLFQQNQMLH